MGTMDLRDAVTFHQLTLAAEGRSQHTIRNYDWYERRFLRYLDEHGIPATLDALNALNVRNAAEWYRGVVNGEARRGGAVAVRQMVERIKTFAHFLEREDVIAPGALDRVKAPTVVKHLRQPFTRDELTALWKAARHTRDTLRDEALFLLLLDTGMRIGEAVGLELTDLQLEAGRVIVGAAGKGRRERIVPIGDASAPDGGRTVHALQVYLKRRPDHGKTQGRVFVSRFGLPLRATGASVIIQRIGRAAGVINPIPHRLRHTFATAYLTEYPGDELGLRRIIGHVSYDVLADYVSLSASTIAERSARASLAETLLPPRLASEASQGPTEPHSLAVPLLDPSAVESAPAAIQGLIAVLRSDAALRRALLEALAGAA